MSLPPLRRSSLFLLSGLLAPLFADPAAETNSLGMKLLPVPAGHFSMGSTLPPANWDEAPLHEVSLSHAFLMSETEVSVADYRRFKPDALLNEAYAPYAAGMSWDDARAFCAWLSQKEGRHYRLPTEAEWEYVARAGRNDGSAWETSAELPNPWGFKNLLSGPVEWCLDFYGDYAHAPESDPVGYSSGFTHVVRGGYLDTPGRSKPADYQRPSARAGAPANFGPSPLASSDAKSQGYGRHRIGFRVVLADDPVSSPKPVLAPYVTQGVKAASELARLAPLPADQPYFRKRRLLPIPPEDSKQEAIIHAGFPPSFRHHNHSPGFAVLPNGDALLIIYTSYDEYEPEVSLMAARLRFGAEEWDMPCPLFDTPGANDHATLLWLDEGRKLWFFWGNPYEEGHFPFQYLQSDDCGASWSAVHFPVVTGPLAKGLERPQPINTVLRADNRQLFLAVDAAGGGDFGSQSMLWTSRDEGASWQDTQGRSAGRHTSFVLKRDGSILGMGGKNSGIDNFMPKAISHDGGKSYVVSKTPFSQLNSGQRPCIIRLASGRLFMAGDFQPSKKTQKPASITESGSYVALSDDDGDTWHIKRLPGAYSEKRKQASVGYCVARQAPNGLIHLITSLNHPAYHFEMNEAWILSEATLPDDDRVLEASHATAIASVQSHTEIFPSGQPHLTWSDGRANDGRLLLEGPETWFYPDGRKQHVVSYHLGEKLGHEAYWSPSGLLLWEWEHQADGVSLWTTYWEDGQLRSRSSWKHHELIPGSDQFFEHR